MMRFITGHKEKLQGAVAIVFWLIIWQIASVAVGYELLLPSPFAVLNSFINLFVKKEYLLSMVGSLARIASGFLLAVILGIFLAWLSWAKNIFNILLSPFMLTIKSIPVASFTVLVLIWLNTSNDIAVFMSFVMVLPIIYTNTLVGIASRDVGLNQMAKVFRVPFLKKLVYVDIPQILPHFITACSLSLGMCWKSGVAAEVIAITNNSIGGQIYDAKLTISTQDVLAWTIVIILFSYIFEKLCMLLLKRLSKFIIEGRMI